MAVVPWVRLVVDDHQLVGVLATAIVVVGSDGRITQVNARAAEVFGVSTDSLLGETIDRVLAPLEVLLEAADNADTRASREIVTSHGETIIVGYSVARLPNHAGVTLVLRDITDVERLREERDRLLRLAAVSEVLPAILHELKNPLASIGSAVELLLEELPSGPVQTDLHAVLSEIRRMGFTLDGLGSVGRELPSARNQAVDYALREVARVFARRAQERGLGINCEVKDMPLLPIDAGVIRGVVFNLVTNALHACEAGGNISLVAGLDESGQKLIIEVRDTGTGMTEKVRERCCELFYTTKQKGSGIGLALAKSAVSSADGQLEIESSPARGTTVRLTIPVGRGASSREFDSASSTSGLRKRLNSPTRGGNHVAHRRAK